jgi:hypothetical protein
LASPRGTETNHEKLQSGQKAGPEDGGDMFLRRVS